MTAEGASDARGSVGLVDRSDESSASALDLGSGWPSGQEAAVTTSRSSTGDPLQAALDLARRGLTVIPVCRPRVDGDGCLHHPGRLPCPSPGKRPLANWRRYQTTPPTEREIRDWFGSWPDANLAIVTGEQSGVVVLDADTPEAIASVEAQGEVGGAPSQRTGKGRHWFFEHPRRHVKTQAGQLGPGIDIRGDGGIVVVAPSVHQSGRRYEWVTPPSDAPLPQMPVWLMAKLDELDKKPGRGDAGPPSLESRVSLDLEAIVGGIDEGCRNDTAYRYASRLRGKACDLNDARMAMLGFASRCKPPMETAEVLDIVERVWEKYPAGEPVLDLRAFERDDDDSAGASHETREPYQFVDAAELDDEPDFDWMVPGVLAPGLLTILGGQAKDGKSTWMAALIGAMQRGEPFMDLETKPVDGVVLLTEEPAASLKEKRDRFGWQAGRTSIMHRGTVGVKPAITAAVDSALARAEQTGATVLIVDSLMYWGGVSDAGGENDSATMQKVMHELVTAAGRGLAVLVIHHSSKDGESLRGSGAIAANVDIILTLKPIQGAGGTRRRLDGVGRSDKVPHNLTIELDGNEYHLVGAQGMSVADHRRGTVATMVLAADKPLTLDEIAADWPVIERAPDHKILGKATKHLVERGLLTQVGRGVKGDPHAYQASPTVRAMEEAIVGLLGTYEAYGPDAAEIAAHLELDVADVRVVLPGLAARGRVRQQGHGPRAIYALADHDDSARGPAILPPALEREVRDVLGSEPATESQLDSAHPTPEEERQVLAVLTGTPRPLGRAEVASASGLGEGLAGAALQALAGRGEIQRMDMPGDPVYGVWF
jgi:hypothetical protein